MRIPKLSDDVSVAFTTMLVIGYMGGMLTYIFEGLQSGHIRFLTVFIPLTIIWVFTSSHVVKGSLK